ncbi:CHAT domain-containing protein [Polluticaenibacter yanchengensis]|uniref:CHAT domain-containing protein n=1 Tax=Polluticaenibacter yanchengensis TaxID=3014562 RepID=A0ABT4UG49_9BACT|nr:CHAT domain-containing protein [Chitinophagaceae bacterium LY-5]
MSPARVVIFFVIVALLLQPIIAQTPVSGIRQIETAIENNKIAEAEKMVNTDLDILWAKGLIDSTLTYLPLIGEISKKQHGADKAIESIYAFILKLEKQKASALQLTEAYNDAAAFFESLYRLNASFNAMEKALEYAYKITPRDISKIGTCKYNLGKFAYSLGRVAESEKFHREALQLHLSNPNLNNEKLYFSYNAMGTILYNSLKYDSAKRYYQKAAEAIAKVKDEKGWNKYFRVSGIKENLVPIYLDEGNITEAINLNKEAINNYQEYLKQPNPSKKQLVEDRLFSSIENLANIHIKNGDFKTAEQLYFYAYDKKVQKGSTEQFISEILIGQLYYKMYHLDKALLYLNKGLKHLSETDGDYIFWQADANYTLALIYESNDNAPKADSTFQLSTALYETAYAGNYDNIYADFTRNKALFYAGQGQYNKALEAIEKLNKYLSSINDNAGHQQSMNLLSLAEINFLSKKYPSAIEYCKKVLGSKFINDNTGKTLLDSVNAEAGLPKAILIKTQSEYYASVTKSEALLKDLHNQLTKALQLIERKRLLFADVENVNNLMIEHKKLIDFYARISYEIYLLTNDETYLQSFINTKESGIYNKLRNELFKQKALYFAEVPRQIIDREDSLKTKIKEALSGKMNNTAHLENYLQAEKNWNNYLVTLNKEYPRYYRLRFGSVFHSIPDIHDLIADSTTLIRYYQVDSSFVALVANKKDASLVPLNTNGITTEIQHLQDNTISEKDFLARANRIYLQLWAPLANKITTTKVKIIPDGILYNISFEMLSSKPVSNYAELSNNCLLNNYAFSYHYNLFVMADNMHKEHIVKNYIAFAPGFSDDLKQMYLNNVKDSLYIDKDYMQLLPQPTNNKLITDLKDKLGGISFLNNESTANKFKNAASNYKIIHVATHAEFNNIQPEKSGLYFAKEKNAENNFLSIADIYNCTVRSNLTILTACESGRPGYKDGEGMVSLAHAFNYSGSQSIMTALWKVDEQSSAYITEYFFKYLEKGLDKDVALQHAKLEYIKSNKGRLINPQYWAGLIVMGDTSPLIIDKGNGDVWWYFLILTGIITGIAIVTFAIKSFSKKARSL